MSFELSDVYAIEGETETDAQGYYASLQRAINAGMWSLQGSYGRTMMSAIESGRCLLGPNAVADYYGNKVPSRTEVQAGTKGSYGFVEAEMGEAWAAAMEAA